MALGVDTTRAFRNPGELAALVNAIHNALAADEANWIEWKSVLNLSTKADQGTLARHVLGMSNRKPAEAARYAGGCGYIVVGIEPTSCHGVTEVDPAALSQGIDPYLGQEAPSWSMSYVQYSGKKILVITVEPPQPGMRAFTLQKEISRPDGGTAYRAGAIFVRRQGRTIQAEPGDIRALEDRLLDVSQPIALLVRPAEPAAQHVELSPYPDVDALIEQWAARRRLELLPPPKPQPRRSAEAGGFVVDPMLTQVVEAAAQAASLFQSMMPEDRRTPGQYAAEVDRYLAAAKEYYAELAFSRYAADNRSWLDLQLANASERNYTDVQVHIDLPSTVRAYDPADVEFPGDQPPSPPKPLGTASLSQFGNTYFGTPSVLSQQLAHPPPNYEIRNNGMIRDFKRIRPEQHANLPRAVLVIREPEGTVLQAAWSVTTADADGVERGTVELRAGKGVTVQELLPELIETPDCGNAGSKQTGFKA